MDSLFNISTPNLGKQHTFGKLKMFEETKNIYKNI